MDVGTILDDSASLEAMILHHSDSFLASADAQILKSLSQTAFATLEKGAGLADRMTTIIDQIMCCQPECNSLQSQSKWQEIHEFLSMHSSIMDSRRMASAKVLSSIITLSKTLQSCPDYDRKADILQHYAPHFQTHMQELRQFRTDKGVIKLAVDTRFSGPTNLRVVRNVFDESVQQHNRCADALENMDSETAPYHIQLQEVINKLEEGKQLLRWTSGLYFRELQRLKRAELQCEELPQTEIDKCKLQTDIRFAKEKMDLEELEERQRGLIEMINVTFSDTMAISLRQQRDRADVDRDHMHMQLTDLETSYGSDVETVLEDLRELPRLLLSWDENMQALSIVLETVITNLNKLSKLLKARFDLKCVKSLEFNDIEEQQTCIQSGVILSEEVEGPRWTLFVDTAVSPDDFRVAVEGVTSNLELLQQLRSSRYLSLTKIEEEIAWYEQNIVSTEMYRYKK